MCKKELNNFLELVSSYNNIEYIYSSIIYNASPTLAKEKPASLITFCDNRNQKRNWEKVKAEIEPKLNIKYFELKKNEKRTIVLFYDEVKLKSILCLDKNLKFLKRFGYGKHMSLQEALQHLSNRFEHICPHEIGIFLGYPVEDVTFFVDCPNEKCKLVGYWKVYHDEDSAKDIFTKYDNIKQQVMKLVISGIKPTEIISSGACLNLNF